ncbi:hypothetical protein NOS3756_33820 [Nostoc sp. NIES-3756]|uniref:caspase family protein n=1 Tax=Nostoc sp. NIES-3756 TaxID=1751286 RepID=UPI0007201DBF|nr:caspase family protein [Nostoc sp. NIES-3756]BAT54413.1 hypothetical protein NOS3756_33820 [Nostoc sp. NIES-3756]
MNNPTNENSDLERKLVPVVTEIKPVEQGRSLVVVIGINEYAHWQKLKNAVQDAIGIQQTLIDKLGFSAPISPLINEAATKLAITSLIEDQLRDELQGDDNLVLFFAGHGHTRVDKIDGKIVGETGFIVPVEARGPKEVWGDYIQIDPLLQSISRLPARHILVILDSCHSGFALGEAMKSTRDAVRYEKDLSSRISRKVITSARREQLALDGGPIPGHSLFTGTLVDGFNWGKADLDGNGLITSSELGLFIQQQVAQASQSNQTPDFGSFYFDDRGEMVISLRNQSFDALKARAFSALQKGELTIFSELVEQLSKLRPSSPEVLYLEYRLTLYQNDMKRAFEIIDTLSNLRFPNGTIPLSDNDIWNLNSQFPCWVSVLSLKDTVEFPLDIEFLIGKEDYNLAIAQKEAIGELEGYLVQTNDIIQLKIQNHTNSLLHIYMIELSSEGRFTPVPLFRSMSLMMNGLQLGEPQLSYPLKENAGAGICTLRLFASKNQLEFFLFPPSAKGRSAFYDSLSDEDLAGLSVKTIYYSITSRVKGLKE